MAQGGETGEGQGIWSTVNAGTAGPTRSTYGQMAGTSMAAPSVSAAAALVRSLGSFTNDQVVQVLKASALKPPELNDYYTCISHDPTTGAERNVCGAGILNLAAIPAPVGHPALTGGSTVGSTLSFTPGRWNGHPDSVTYQWLRNGAAIAGATATSYQLTAADLGPHPDGALDGAHAGLSGLLRGVGRQGRAQGEGVGGAAAVVDPGRVSRTRLYAYVTVTAAQGQAPTGHASARTLMVVACRLADAELGGRAGASAGLRDRPGSTRSRCVTAATPRVSARGRDLPGECVEVALSAD